MSEVDAKTGSTTVASGSAPNGHDAILVMSRERAYQSTFWEGFFERRLKEPEWAGPESEYFDGLNRGAAEFLNGLKGKDPLLQDYMTYYVAHMLQAEKRVRDKSATTVAGARGGNEVSPEDKLLEALADLLKEAKGKDAAHQEAMMKAGAEMVDAVRGIKEARHRVADYRNDPRIEHARELALRLPKESLDPSRPTGHPVDGFQPPPTKPRSEPAKGSANDGRTTR